MIDENILNLQIAILVLIGTIIFIIVSLQRNDLVIYLPTYIMLPIGEIFIYLQLFQYWYRLVGNLFFTISLLTYIAAIFYEYSHTPKKQSNGKKFVYNISPLMMVIMGFQIFMSSLLVLAIIILFKLYYRTRKGKYLSLSLFPITALMTSIATILSFCNIKGAWEFSYLSNIVLGAAYLSFPIINFLDIRLEVFGTKLKLEQKRAESYFQLAGDIMVGLDINGAIVILNQKGCEVLRYTQNELLGKDYFETCIPIRIRSRLKEAYKNMLMGNIETDKYYQNAIITKDGKERMIKWYNSLVYNNIGDVIGLLSSGVDITEKLQLEQDLRESERKYELITENANDLIALVNNKYEYEYINEPAYYTILGYSKSDLLGEKVWELVHPEDLKFIVKSRDISLNGFEELEGVDKAELRIKHKKGHYIWVEYTSKVFVDNQGNPNVIVISRDITEKKTAEQLIKEENKKLLELDKLRRELITRISHELKTPLTSIYGALQILVRSDKEAAIEGILPYIGISYRGSIRLKELVDNLLDVTRLETGKFELKISEENIKELICNCIEELELVANSRDIIMYVDIPNDVCFPVDTHSFTEVVLNILSNAIKNTPPQGTVDLSIRETKEYLDIVIKDTGVGITQKEKEVLFQRFGKIERYGMGLDIDTEGPGLGLYIAKEIMELHGGEIIVESEGRNKGSTFIMRLPKKFNQNL